MKALARNILIAVGGACLLQQAQILLESDYIIRFLDGNLEETAPIMNGGNK